MTPGSLSPMGTNCVMGNAGVAGMPFCACPPFFAAPFVEGPTLDSPLPFEWGCVAAGRGGFCVMGGLIAEGVGVAGTVPGVLTGVGAESPSEEGRGRAFAPDTFTVRPGLRIGRASRSAPSSQRVRSTGNPNAASSASAMARSRTFDRVPRDESTAAAKAGEVSPVSAESASRIDRTSPVSLESGPTSRKNRTPASFMASILATNSTGLASWAASKARAFSASAGYGAAVLLA